MSKVRYVFINIETSIFILTVPDKGSRNCPDPELSGTGTEGSAVREVGQVVAGPGPPDTWGDSSRDQSWAKFL